MIHISDQKGGITLKEWDKSTILLILLLILLPIAIAGVYIVQTRSSDATASCEPTNVRSERLTNSMARISFDTSCPVKAQVYCAAARAGVQFFCGEDAAETTRHIIETDEVTLSSNVGYYTFIDTNMPERTLGFIHASPVDATYGLNFDSLNKDTLGLEVGEEGYDPALDINQDGIINILDKVEFYPDVR